MTQETSSPTIIPKLTKTDARELKSLVRRDTEILSTELDTRKKEFEDQLKSDYNKRVAVIDEERQRRADEDQKEADKATAALIKKVKALNEAIVAHMEQMAEEGWTIGGRYGGAFDPHAFTVSMPNFLNLKPPSQTYEDLDEEQTELREEHEWNTGALNANYRDAKRTLEVEEARMLRELTLESITTEHARQFILEMPDVENLLPMPERLRALEG